MINRIFVFVIFCVFCAPCFSQIYDRDSTATIHAIDNMFKRKRNGGVARAVVFGLVAISVVAFGSTHSDPPKPIYVPSAPGLTLVYYPANTQPQSSAAGNAFGAVVFGGIAITGIIQASKFSEKNRLMVVESYRRRNGIPQKYQKFKTKDFKVE